MGRTGPIDRPSGLPGEKKPRRRGSDDQVGAGSGLSTRHALIGFIALAALVAGVCVAAGTGGWVAFVLGHAVLLVGGGLMYRLEQDRSTELEAVEETLEKLLTTQKQMLEAVSHELRTPIARLQFRTEALRGKGLDDGVLDAMDQDLAEIDTLLAELTSYLRIDSMDARIEDVDLEALCEKLVARQRLLYAHIDVRVVGSVHWKAPSKMLARAIDNLLRNAMRHATSVVEIRIDMHRIAVEDDGPGVSLHDRERILEPFETVLASRENAGIGLGLAIVDRICRKLKYTLQVADSDLGGASFVLSRGR